MDCWCQPKPGEISRMKVIYAEIKWKVWNSYVYSLLSKYLRLKTYSCLIWILCDFVAVWFWPIFSISFRVTSLVLGQSHDCPSTSEAAMKDMGKYKIQQNIGGSFKSIVLRKIKIIYIWIWSCDSRSLVVKIYAIYKLQYQLCFNVKQ